MSQCIHLTESVIAISQLQVDSDGRLYREITLECGDCGNVRTEINYEPDDDEE